MSLFDEIRTASSGVAETARSVRIDADRLSSLANLLNPNDLNEPSLDPNSHFLGHGEATAAFIVVLNAINFGSGWFPVLKKRPAMSGYFTIASALAEVFQKSGPFSAEVLASLDTGDCTRFFGQDPANIPIQDLMHHFKTALNDLGRYVLETHEGRFGTLIQSARGKAESLVASLARMPYYRDVSRYRGLIVPFYKRAQLTAADLAVAFAGREWGRFTDLADTTIFADNLVPHVLRIDGVLVYNDDLARRVDSGALIPAGSSEEVEIRACALHAVELMVQQLRGTGKDISPAMVDYFLWNKGQHPLYKAAKPRHRTRTVYY
jgi:putative queuosine salvage protein